jgi:hypothetical protein
LQGVEKRLAEKIFEINLPFEEELKTIEEDEGESLMYHGSSNIYGAL